MLLSSIDVIVCLFPTSQCMFLMNLQKFVIIRFMHRYDHLLRGLANLKWSLFLQESQKACGNGVLLTTSNLYDYMQIFLKQIYDETRYLHSTT